MKKILLAITAIIITASAYAQDDSSNKKMYPPDIDKTNDGLNMNNNRDKDQNLNANQTIQNNPDSIMDQKAMKNHPDGYMMLNGKMMVVMDGKMTIMEKDVTLSNGTMIMTNGTYMKKGAARMMLKEGEHLDMTGKLIPMNRTSPKIY